MEQSWQTIAENAEATGDYRALQAAHEMLLKIADRKAQQKTPEQSYAHWSSEALEAARTFATVLDTGGSVADALEAVERLAKPDCNSATETAV